MNNIHIKDYISKKVHFIGIGGISMSGLAEILLVKGYLISGSDLQHSNIIERLKDKGAQIFAGHDKSNLQNVDLVVYTAAVKEDNPEMIAAHNFGIPVMDRAMLLGQIMEAYNYAIGVSGTHGKTTTTSILSIIMEQASLDPTILVGGELDAIGGNVRTGSSNYFITEACEYVESFLKFHPSIAVVLNIDSDHLDYFKDINHIYQSFAKYAALVPKKGYLIGCNDDKLVSRLLGEVKCHSVSYGINTDANWQAKNIEYDEKGCPSYRAVYNKQDMGWFSLNVPGLHNIYNALAATAAAWTLGISGEVIRSALLSYKGTHRRFEIKGTTENGVTIIDDYAHHPTEIMATLAATKNISHKKLWCVFQPHTYTRTKMLFNEFTEAFDGVDNLILTDIYAAREKDSGEIHSRDLAQAVADKGKNSLYLPSFEKITSHLKDHARPGDIILTMGAGNVDVIGSDLLRNG